MKKVFLILLVVLSIAAMNYTGPDYLNFLNGLVGIETDLTIKSGAGNTDLFIDTNGAGTYAGMVFRNNSSVNQAMFRYSEDDNDLYISDSAGTTHWVTIDNAGNVGIGTASPTSLLEIETAVTAGGNYETMLLIENTTEGSAGCLFFQGFGETAEGLVMGAQCSDSQTGFPARAATIRTGGGGNNIMFMDAGIRTVLWAYATSLTFATPANTIILGGAIADEDWTKQNLMTGSSILFAGTVSNNLEYTVKSIDSATQITVYENVVNETVADMSANNITVNSRGNISIASGDTIAPTGQNVAIGTTFASAKMEIVGGGVYPYFKIGSAYDTGDIMTIDEDGNVGIGTDSPLAIQHNAPSGSLTNTAEEGLRIQAITDGTAAAGFGGLIRMQGEDDSGANRDMAFIRAVWESAATASYVGQLELLPSNNGTPSTATGMVIEGGGLIRTGVQASVTANVGSTQATGERITHPIVEISVCANAGDSLTLPTAIAGYDILIINHGANSADIFPNTSDAINEAAVNTAKALAADASMRCVTYDTINWECLTMAR